MREPILQMKTITVIQGDFAVSKDENTKMATLLGSCVATCLYDPLARIGGMNHFLLPGFCDSSSGTMSCGLNMMELLINGLLRQGADRRRLQAKMFGGAQLNGNLTNIGEQNIEFTRDFLKYEGISLLGESVGGNVGRRIQFCPTSGKARQRFVSNADIHAAEKIVKAPTAVVSADLELF